MSEPKSSNYTPIIVALIAAISSLGVAYIANIKKADSASNKKTDTVVINPISKPTDSPKKESIVKHVVDSLPKPSITTYETIRINDQVWATKEFDGTTYQNNDKIPQVKDVSDLNRLSGQGSWCYYEFNPDNGPKYGKLYNWYAVNDARGLAPPGWHVPTEKEWSDLINGIGKENSAIYLKNQTGWYHNGNGNNASKWAGLPRGVMYASGKPTAYGLCGVWWSMDISGDRQYGVMFELDASKNDANIYNFDPNAFCSVRFIKDKQE